MKHIKDVQSTCRGSCNTRMECWWLSTSSTSVSFWYSTSLSALCTQWGQNKVSLSSPSFSLCSSGPDRHVPKTKANPGGQSTERGQNNLKLVTANRCGVCCFSKFLEIRSESRLYFLGQCYITMEQSTLWSDWPVGGLDDLVWYFMLPLHYTIPNQWRWLIKITSEGIWEFAATVKLIIFCHLSVWVWDFYEKVPYCLNLASRTLLLNRQFQSHKGLPKVNFFWSLSDWNFFSFIKSSSRKLQASGSLAPFLIIFHESSFPDAPVPSRPQ